MRRQMQVLCGEPGTSQSCLQTGLTALIEGELAMVPPSRLPLGSV